MKNYMTIAILALASASTACSFHARAEADYAKDTKNLLKSKDSQIKSCYDEVLKKNPKAGGVVAVDFKVTPKTGEVTDPKINKKKTTAGKRVRKCVLDAMDGLVLDPPDQREGVASFAYDFKANKAKQL